jgi:hypothetical protein
MTRSRRRRKKTNVSGHKYVRLYSKNAQTF